MQHRNRTAPLQQLLSYRAGDRAGSVPRTAQSLKRRVLMLYAPWDPQNPIQPVTHPTSNVKALLYANWRMSLRTPSLLSPR